MSRSVALLLITVLVVISLVLAGCAFAQSIPTPSVPEFTVASGAQNETIIITIKNQPFTSYTDSDGDVVRLYYTVRAERNFEEYTEVYPASDSEYTTIITSLQTYPPAEIWGNSSSGEELYFQLSLNAKIGKSSLSFDHSQYVFTGETSDWSKIQTLIIRLIPTPSPSPELTSSPYEEPQLSEQEVILGVAVTVAIAGAGIGLLFYLIRRK